MCKMDILEAQTNFSKIIALLERKEESEVIVTREGIRRNSSKRALCC